MEHRNDYLTCLDCGIMVAHQGKDEKECLGSRDAVVQSSIEFMKKTKSGPRGIMPDIYWPALGWPYTEAEKRMEAENG